MNIKPHQGFSTHRAKNMPGSGQAAPHPKDDGKFTIDDIICPFQRTAYNEGVLKVDDEGNVTNLPEVLKEFAGASWAMTGIANHAAKKLSADDSNWDAMWADSYNMQDLADSGLDHDADTQILRNGFSQERLDRALSFSADGERLTLEDLKTFQEANLKEEPGKNGKIFGGAEFALLVKTFGRTDGMGTKFIKNKDFVSIFKDNKWPEGWTPPAKGSLSIFSTGLAVKEYFSTDARADSQESTEVTNASEGGQAQKSKGVCPFLQGQPYDMAEAAKQHSDKLH